MLHTLKFHNYCLLYLCLKVNFYMTSSIFSLIKKIYNYTSQDVTVFISGKSNMQLWNLFHI